MSWHIHAMHPPAVCSHNAHVCGADVHVMHTHVMHAHVVHTHALHYMFYVRIKSNVPTVALGPKPVSQWHGFGTTENFFGVLLKIKGDRPTVAGNTTAPCSLPPKCNIHCKKAMSECAKFRCWQRWRRTKGRGSRNFPTPTSFGSRHRCPHQNFAQLFLQCNGTASHCTN